LPFASRALEVRAWRATSVDEAAARFFSNLGESYDGDG
jgi:hypothetical protein